MAPHHEDDGAIPEPVAVALRRLYQRFDLALQQMFAAPLRAVRFPRRHGFAGHDLRLFTQLNCPQSCSEITLFWPSAKHSPSIT